MKIARMAKILVHEDLLKLAIKGDRNALDTVMKSYDVIIEAELLKELRRRHIQPDLLPLEDIKQDIRLELYKAIRKFKI